MFKQVEANCGKRTKILGNLQFTQRKEKRYKLQKTILYRNRMDFILCGTCKQNIVSIIEHTTYCN